MSRANNIKTVICIIYLTIYTLSIYHSNSSIQSLDVFLSSQESLEQILVNHIYYARQSVDIATFTFNNNKIAQLLIDKAKNDIFITILCDGKHKNKLLSRLENTANIRVIYMNTHSAALFHPKIIVIDAGISFIGSANLSSKMDSMYNMYIRIDNKDLALFLSRCIQTQNFSSQFHTQEISMSFFPANAKYIYQYIIQTLHEGKNGLLSYPTISMTSILEQTASDITKNIHITPPDRRNHCKYALIDDQLIVGSFNLSKNAFNRNTESCLIIKHTPRHIRNKVMSHVQNVTKTRYQLA